MAPDRGNIQANLEILNLRTGNYDEARRFARQLGITENLDPAPSIAVADALENPELKPRAVEMMENWEELPDGAMYKSLYLMILEFESPSASVWLLSYFLLLLNLSLVTFDALLNFLILLLL